MISSKDAADVIPEDALQEFAVWWCGLRSGRTIYHSKNADGTFSAKRLGGAISIAVKQYQNNQTVLTDKDLKATFTTNGGLMRTGTGVITKHDDKISAISISTNLFNATHKNQQTEFFGKVFNANLFDLVRTIS